ncbi:MAG TPA: glycosyltransferase family 39 protein [Chloroflexota bacterium]
MTGRALVPAFERPIDRLADTIPGTVVSGEVSMSSGSIPVAHESATAHSTVVVAPWHRIALGAILVLAAALNLIRLGSVGLSNTYYAAAVKSMLQGWHNFFFVSFDPGGFVTIDKPPVAFWLQTASARIFGFGGISLILPEAVAGIVSVALLYLLVARSFGRPAGLIAALALAITPVEVVVNRSNLIESILVLALLLAVWAVMRAGETGKLGWLLLGFAAVGLGFNIKMLEAYLVAPALVLAYLLGAPVRWWTRIWHLLLAGAVLLVVSLVWVTVVDLTPAGQRPYVASSGNNSELSLALGYNGLARLTGNTFSFLNGGASLSNTLSDLSPTNLGFTRAESGNPGIQRLFNAELGSQTGWLLILAVIGFIVAAWQTRVRLPLNRQQKAIVLWGAWLATGGAFFSIAGFFHAYYLATIAPPIAALVGIGATTLWRDYQRPGWRGWALPPALIIAALVQAHILSYFPAWNGWLTPLVVGSSIVLAVLLTAVRLMRTGSRPMSWITAGLALLALLLTPFIWSEYTVAHAASGLTPSAGPAGNGGFGGPGGVRSSGPRGGFFTGAPGGVRRFEPSRRLREFFAGRGFGGPGRDQSTANPNLVRFLEAHQGRAKFLVATLSANEAEPFILSTGRPVMDLGGFLGGDHILSVRQLAADVSRGTVRYFLIGGRGFAVLGGFSARPPQNITDGGRLIPAPRRAPGVGYPRVFNGGPGGALGGRGNSDLTDWVTSHCTTVPASAYGSASTAPSRGSDFQGAQPLYDCGRQK